MKLYEYQAKELLRKYGISVPCGRAVDNLSDALRVSEELGFPLAIKAQVYLGGRGKAGAIKIVSHSEEFKRIFSEILGKEINGLRVKRVLIERALEIKKQFYLGITLDRSHTNNVLIGSSEGGMEIEELAKLYPERIIKFFPKRCDYLDKEEAGNFVSLLGLPDSLIPSFAETVMLLFALYISMDAQLLEINPLALTEGDNLFACDAKLIIDDNALFRQQDLRTLSEEACESELEYEAHKLGLAYVKLSGDIGIIGNGAGLVMATMDEVKRVGGAPANFLDIGGGAKRELVENALTLVSLDKQVRGIFINIFGGITRCDEVAYGIIEALKKTALSIPLVIRLAGTQCEEAKRLLRNSNLIAAESMQEGARRIVELVKGSNIKNQT